MTIDRHVLTSYDDDPYRCNNIPKSVKNSSVYIKCNDNFVLFVTLIHEY